MLNKNKNSLELGIIILYNAIPISQILKINFGFENINFSNILLIISLFLIGDFSDLGKSKLYSINSGFLLLIFYQIYNIIIAMINEVSFFEPGYGIIYILFTIIFIFSLSTNNREFYYDKLIKYSFYITGIFNTFLTYYLVMQVRSGSLLTINSIYSSTNNLIADRLTLSTIAFNYLIGFISYNPSIKKEKILKQLFLFSALINIAATARRGLFIALIIIIIFNLYIKAKNSLKKTFSGKKIIIYLKNVVLIVGFYLFLYYNSVTIKELSDSFGASIQKGMSTFFGINKYGIDLAAGARVTLRDQALEKLSNSNLFQILFGHGYMSEWIDFPFLQAIIDMGIFGGGAYIFIQTYIIAKAILYNKIFEKKNLLIINFALLGFVYNFFSGIPYGYYKYIYLIPLYYMVFLKKTNYKSKKNYLIDDISTIK